MDLEIVVDAATKRIDPSREQIPEAVTLPSHVCMLVNIAISQKTIPHNVF